MNNIEKILELIKNDKEIAEQLFLFDEIPEDVTIWTGEEGESDFDFSNIRWLFSIYHSNLTLVGVNTVDGTIWCIDDDGDFHQDCDALQNLPYEIIRIDCKYTPNKTVEEYFDKNEPWDIKAILERYEQWCKDNHIELDKNKIYHDENGNLFTKFFYLDDET